MLAFQRRPRIDASRTREFDRLLKKTKSELVERTNAMLTGGGGEAVKTVLRLMREHVPFQVQLGAARPPPPTIAEGNGRDYGRAP